jgi:hypothetical protein
LFDARIFPNSSLNEQRQTTALSPTPKNHPQKEKKKKEVGGKDKRREQYF